jgi:hypothetical protein
MLCGRFCDVLERLYRRTSARGAVLEESVAPIIGAEREVTCAR